MIDQRSRAILLHALALPSEVVSVGEDYERPEGVVKEHVEHILRVPKAGTGVV